jgi:hypothetical protein
MPCSPITGHEQPRLENENGGKWMVSQENTPVARSGAEKLPAEKRVCISATIESYMPNAAAGAEYSASKTQLEDCHRVVSRTMTAGNGMR